jgi:hypothetical protein
MGFTLLHALTYALLPHAPVTAGQQGLCRVHAQLVGPAVSTTAATAAAGC